MKDTNRRKEERILLLEKRCQDQESYYKEELNTKTKQIDEFNMELNQKTAIVAQLTTQVS